MDFFATLGNAPGLNDPPYNPCRLLGFSLLNLAAGEEYVGDTGDREYCAVILGGKASFHVEGLLFENVGERPNVLAGLPSAVYLPRGAHYTVRGETAVQIALPSAPSDLDIEPYAIGPKRITTGVWGAANFRRYFRQILTLAGQPDLPARRLIVGETITPSGNWSTYPPHRHEKDDLPREAYHEEMYYFKVIPAEGFGICSYYSGDLEQNYTVRDNSLLMAPKGYHTVVSAPGYTTYYLWFLAGEQRIQGSVDDPALGWVSKAVPMLTELGH